MRVRTAAGMLGGMTEQERNKAVVRRFIEEYATGADPRALEECLAEDIVDHTGPPGLPPGREGVRLLFEGFRSAFPDFRAEIHQLVAEGDLVAMRKTFYGTHEGELQGIPPTGREVAFGELAIVRVRDGRVVEHWNVVDQLSLMQQLGAVGAPA